LRASALALVVLCVASAAHAQLRGIKADATPLVESDGVHAGTNVRLALQVSLPKGFTSSRTNRAIRCSSRPSGRRPRRGVGGRVVFPSQSIGNKRAPPGVAV
jgi:hypothetical protein